MGWISLRNFSKKDTQEVFSMFGYIKINLNIFFSSLWARLPQYSIEDFYASHFKEYTIDCSTYIKWLSRSVMDFFYLLILDTSNSSINLTSVLKPSVQRY